MNEIQSPRDAEHETFSVKVGLARMLCGGVIMDVTNVEQARDRRGVAERRRRDGARARSRPTSASEGRRRAHGRDRDQVARASSSKPSPFR